MNKEIELLHNTIDNQNKIINEQTLEIAKLKEEKEELQAEIEELKVDNEWWTCRYKAEHKIAFEDLQPRIDRALSFIGILHNNLKDYTEYQEYTDIFNEMLKDIEEILGGNNE